MSMRPAFYRSTDRQCDYVVVAPQAADILSVALRSAYGEKPNADDPFADLIYQLDRIEAVATR